jgi:hypothetical protein
VRLPDSLLADSERPPLKRLRLEIASPLEEQTDYTAQGLRNVGMFLAQNIFLERECLLIGLHRLIEAAASPLDVADTKPSDRHFPLPIAIVEFFAGNHLRKAQCLHRGLESSLRVSGFQQCTGRLADGLGCNGTFDGSRGPLGIQRKPLLERCPPNGQQHEGADRKPCIRDALQFGSRLLGKRGIRKGRLLLFLCRLGRLQRPLARGLCRGDLPQSPKFRIGLF